MSQFYSEIVALMQAADFEQALVRLNAHLTATPDDVEARHLRALAHGRTGQYDAARQEFTALESLHPQPHAVMSNLGNLEVRAGRPDAAATAYRKALDYKPDFSDAGVNLANLLAGQGQVDAAADLFETVLSHAPTHLGALNGLGNARLRQDRPEDALSAFNRALEVNPGAVLCRINRAGAYRSLGQLEAALSDLEAACQQAPNGADGHFQRGVTLRMLKRDADARLAFQVALTCDAMRADIHSAYAGLLWENGAGEESTVALRSVLERQPNADLSHVLARIQLRSGQPDAALASTESALQSDPGHALSLALRGELRIRLGDHASGLADLAAADAASGGTNPVVRLQYAEALLGQGEAKKALDLLDHEPEGDQLQKYVALKTLAWRELGDERYRSYYDYDRFTWTGLIETPDGFDSLEDFNRQLSAAIARLHTTRVQPLDQTLFGGTQSPGRLWNESDPVIAALSQALLAAAKRFVDGLPDDSDHPFLQRKTGAVKLAGAWSVRLHSGGGHVDHIHPAGWISASYYVDVPKTVMDGDKAGWLRLGGSGVSGLDLPAERHIRPEPGRIVFFPSYMWHGVEPFESDSVRVTAPFDVIPA